MPTYEEGTGRLIPDRVLLTQQQFLDRWEAAGLGAVLDMLYALEVKDSPAGAKARRWLSRFNTAVRGIDPEYQPTIDGTNGLLASAVLANVVTQEQADAGRAIVLAPL